MAVLYGRVMNARDKLHIAVLATATAVYSYTGAVLAHIQLATAAWHGPEKLSRGARMHLQ